MLFTSNTIANLTATKFCMERQLHTMKSEITEIYIQLSKHHKLNWFLVMIWLCPQNIPNKQSTYESTMQENNHTFPLEYDVGDKILFRNSMTNL